MKREKLVFLVWTVQTRRSLTLAMSLEARLIFLNGARKSFLLKLLRYLQLTVKTLKVLKMERPDLVFVQNPPLYSLLPVFLYARWYHKKYIIDSHTRTFCVERIHHRLFLQLHRYFSRFATVLLLHNEDLSPIGKSWRAPFFILEDRIPPFDLPPKRNGEKKKPTLAVICSFSPDEPIREILEAAERLEKVHFNLTGNNENFINEWRLTHPSNITFTGFLEEGEYLRLLQESDAILVLTKRPFTLLCGAYEAVAVGRPLITSNLPLLKRHFQKGTIHVENTPEGIEGGIRRALSSLDRLSEEIIELKKEKEKEWKRRFEILQKVLYEENR